MPDEQKKRTPAFSIIDPFTITLRGEVQRRMADGMLTFTLIIYKTADGENKDAYRPFAIEIPLASFTLGDLQDIERGYKENFLPTLRLALSNEAFGHFNDSIKIVAADIEGTDPQAVIDEHLKMTAERLRHMLDVPKERRGRRSDWSPLELHNAIFQAMLKIENKQSINYKTVAKKLQEMYGDKAPPTEAALKKLVERHKIDWMAIKRYTKNRHSVT